jgi:predicted rRNA methylase YqxC with S4 and FtsJ domains
VSYLALGSAVGQVTPRVQFARDAELLGLVKPQFEVGRSGPPTAAEELEAAVEIAIEGVEAAGWVVLGTKQSPVRGSRGGGRVPAPRDAAARRT